MTHRLRALSWLIIVALSFTSLHAQRKNKDPFARSARLPDMSVGLLFNANTQVKYKIPGGSLALNTTFYHYDWRFLVGLEFITNIKQHTPTVLIERDPEVIEDQSNFKRLIYNQMGFGLRGGYIVNENFYFTLGGGVELLEQMREMRAIESSELPETFLQNANKNVALFYLKYGLQYKYRYWIYDLFFSSRGVGVGVNYFFNG